MEILHADASIVVINKPTGLAVLGDGWEAGSVNLMSLLEAQFGRTWMVHRLDKGTSGVLVVARTEAAHRELSMQFEQHGAGKVYHAIACGDPGWNERTTRQPLRLNVGHKHRTAIDQARGKPSTTTFKVLERFSNHVLLEARPLTGRTHQVRAHAAALHLPLLGDVLYGAAPTELIARPALHALELDFVHPESGSRVKFTAPRSADFESALASLRSTGTRRSNNPPD